MRSVPTQNFLFIQDHLFGGGAERITLDIAEKLAESGHQVTLALLDATDIRMKIPPSIRFVDLDVEESMMRGRLWRKRPPISISTQRKITALIESNKPDTIIVGHWFSYLLSNHMTGNVWFWIHCEILSEKPNSSNFIKRLKFSFRRPTEELLLKKTLDKKNIIAVSQDLADTYKPFLPSSNILVIPNGVNKSRLAKDLPINLLEKKWSTIFVGRLSAEKQPEHALYAFKKSNIDGKMAVVGDGKMLNKLKGICKKLEIEDRVDFLGWQENPQFFIKHSHTLILSSKAEGFGLVIAEALLLNIPVVAYGCSSGVRQQLKSQNLQRGIAKPQDIDDLADKLADIYLNPYPVTLDDQAPLTLEPMAKSFEQLKFLNQSS